jgi:hypothetical protein
MKNGVAALAHSNPVDTHEFAGFEEPLIPIWDEWSIWATTGWRVKSPTRIAKRHPRRN